MLKMERIDSSSSISRIVFLAGRFTKSFARHLPAQQVIWDANPKIETAAQRYRSQSLGSIPRSLLRLFMEGRAHAGPRTTGRSSLQINTPLLAAGFFISRMLFSHFKLKAFHAHSSHRVAPLRGGDGLAPFFH